MMNLLLWVFVRTWQDHFSDCILYEGTDLTKNIKPKQNKKEGQGEILNLYNPVLITLSVTDFFIDSIR